MSRQDFGRYLEQANQLRREKGISAVRNPHGMIGEQCGCNDCFTCACAAIVRTEEMNSKWYANLRRQLGRAY